MQCTIYIRKDNQERWKSITDKSAWVNAYLEKSPPNSVVISKNLEPESLSTGGAVSGRVFTGTRLIDPYPKEKQDTMYKLSVCKIHETPLTEFGKCLQKGCKYGK